MLDRSARFDAALMNSHTSVTAAAVRVGTAAPIPLQVISGSVASTGDHGPRRSLTLEVANTGVEWAALQPAGAIVTVVRGISYGGGTGQEHVSMGVFRVDDTSLTWTDNQSISFIGPDRWGLIQDAQFEVTTKPTQATYVSEIAHLLTVAGGGSPLVTATEDQPIPAKGITYTTSREDAIYALADAIGADVFFGADGRPVIADLPTAKTPPVWTIAAGGGGTLVTASYEATRVDTYNVIVVQPSSTDGKIRFAQVTAADTNPASPTYVSGPFGRRPRFLSSDLIKTAAQAQHVAAAQLSQTMGLHSQITLTALEQPALEVHDSVRVNFPPRPGVPRSVQWHIVDAMTFSFDGSPQQLTTRAVGAAETPTGAVVG